MTERDARHDAQGDPQRKIAFEQVQRGYVTSGREVVAQMNGTPWIRSHMGFPLRLRRATGCQVFDQRCADFRPSIAAILQHEQHHGLKRTEIGAIDDRAAEPLRGHQPGAGQDRKMGRHGVLRDRQRTGDVARGKPVRLVLHQQAENIQPGRLGQRGESEDDLL